MYTQESIDKVKDLEIFPAIGKYIELKKEGANYKGKSPFKEENTPSLVVSPAKNMYKCFATGKGGDLIDFYMSTEKCGFIEAVEVLANDNGLLLDKAKLSKEEKVRVAKKEEFYNLATATQKQFSRQLFHLDTNFWAIKHLRDRNYTEDTFIEWQLGYAGNGGNISHMAKEKALLGPAKEIGIVGESKDNRSYDSFRDRIIFPIHNHKGTVVGFGGRRQNGDDQKSAKYLNSKESDIYYKKQILYGLHLAKHAIRKKNHAVLVEGYTDVITMHKYGADTTIATCGTAFTPEQAKLLKQFCKTVYVMRDGDAAGVMATEKDLKILLSHGFHVHVYMLPEKQDPDTFAPKHDNIENEVLNHSQDALIWKFKRIAESFVSEYYLKKVDEINNALELDTIPLREELKSDAEINTIIAQTKQEVRKHNVDVNTLIEELENQAEKDVDVLDSESETYKQDSSKIKKNLSIAIADEKETLRNAKKEADTKRKELETWNKQIKEQIKEIVNQAKDQLKGLTKIDSYNLEKGQNEACDLLFSIKTEVTREFYTKQAADILKIKETNLKRQIAAKLKRALDQKNQQKPTAKKLGLPEGCTNEHVDFFLENRFLEYKNQYYFQNKDVVDVGSNMILKPLYHINGKEENKRLCEVENIYGHRQLIDFDSESFVSLNELKRELIRRGNFMFTGVGVTEFELLTQRVMSGFEEAKPLINLGQSEKGFFAFANGIVKPNGEFEKANKYGVIHVPTEEEEQDKDEDLKAYSNNSEYYYTPAFSIIHRYNQKGDDPYESDRTFVYKKSPITLDQWQNYMIDVFGNKGKMAIMFAFGALFRDLFLHNYSYFPLLGCFGQKGTGKSGIGEALQNFFSYGQKPLDLTQATPVAFSRKVSRVRNGLVFLDEAKENNDTRLLSGIMGGWNGIGREKGTLKKGATETDIVNSALVYCGQYLLSYQDNGLAERTISMLFPEKQFTEEEKKKYNEFLQHSKKGLSSLLLDIIKHRTYVKENINSVYEATSRDLKKSFNYQGIKERILQNHLVLLTTYKLLEDKISFPFSYKEIKKICIASIQQNSENIQDSDTTSQFWKCIQRLYEKGFIKEGNELALDEKPSIKILKNSKDVSEWHNKNRVQLLYLRMNSVHTEYAKMCREINTDALGESTLRSYLKDKPYFIGAMKSRRFNKASSSCLVFNYTEMNSNDNLILSLEKQQQEPPTKQGDETLKLSEDEKDRVLF